MSVFVGAASSIFTLKPGEIRAHQYWLKRCGAQLLENRRHGSGFCGEEERDPSDAPRWQAKRVVLALRVEPRKDGKVNKLSQPEE